MPGSLTDEKKEKFREGERVYKPFYDEGIALKEKQQWDAERIILSEGEIFL